MKIKNTYLVVWISLMLLNIGTISAGSFILTDYSPTGINLSDDDWLLNPNGSASYTFNPTCSSGFVLQPSQDIAIENLVIDNAIGEP